MTHSTHALLTSKHFHLEQLSEGIYAAFSIDGTGSMSNAGIIDLGETTLIFDTFATPQAAQDLRRAAEQLIGQPITYVVNSHKHGDHWHGNQVFLPDAQIIASGKTYAELLKRMSVSKEKMQLNIEDEQTRHSLGYGRQVTTMFLLEYLGDRSELGSLDEEIDQVRFYSAVEVCQSLGHQETKAYFMQVGLQKEQKG